VEKVAQQAGKAAPAFAIAGALVAVPHASHGIAAAGNPVTGTARGVTTGVTDKAVSTVEHAGVATLDSVETHAVTVSAAKAARHAATTARSTYYSVRSGDSLSKIASSYYHNAGDWQYLYHENDKTVSDPNLIFVGQRLLIPAAVPEHYSPGDYVPKHSKVTQPATATVGETSREASGATHTTIYSTGHSTGPSANGARHVVTQSAPQGMYACSALEQLWEQEGGSPAAAVMAAEIAMAESGGDPNAISPTDDFGLWQINGSNGALATLNPFQNAKSAITLSDDGTNWNPWTTYHSGAYSGRC
jgi:LysM repeat protein